MIEDSGLMPRVKKVVFRTRCQSVMLPLSLSSFGTPEVRYPHQRYVPVYSVHRKAFSRTFSIPKNNRRPLFWICRTMPPKTASV